MGAIINGASSSEGFAKEFFVSFGYDVTFDGGFVREEQANTILGFDSVDLLIGQVSKIVKTIFNSSKNALVFAQIAVFDEINIVVMDALKMREGEVFVWFDV